MSPLRFGLPIQRLEVVDGDTLKATVVLDEYVRLVGIDAPEMRVERERPAALVVAAAAKRWIIRQDYVSCNPVGYDKFGHRVLCVVNGSEGRDLATWLLVERLVRHYDGARKDDWPQDELDRIAARASEFDT